MAGGLARRATVVEGLRAETPNLLLLDCGTVFSTPNKKDKEKKAEVVLAAMDFMGYDALNLGSREFFFGPEYLKNKSTEIKFPFLASNLREGDTQPSWAKPYLLKTVGDIKVAVLGVLPETAFNSQDVTPDDDEHDHDHDHEKPTNKNEADKITQPGNLRISQPQAALAELLPELKEQAEVIILLSQLPVTETGNLLANLPDIDLAVTCGEENVITPDRVYQSGAFGKELRYVQVDIGSDGTLTPHENEAINLNDSVAYQPEVAAMVETIFAKMRAAQRAQKDADRQFNLQKGLTMSPEQFMELMKKQQADNQRLNEVPPATTAQPAAESPTVILKQPTAN